MTSLKLNLKMECEKSYFDFIFLTPLPKMKEATDWMPAKSKFTSFSTLIKWCHFSHPSIGYYCIPISGIISLFWPSKSFMTLLPLIISLHISTCDLQSSSTLYHLKISCSLSFLISCPLTWLSLPLYLHNSTCLSSSQSYLKMYLFQDTFSNWDLNWIWTWI